MKRVLLSIAGTVVCVTALLSFKTHGHGLRPAAGGLPSAGAPAPVASATSPSRSVASTGAPPDPSRSRPAASTSASAAATYVGDPVDTQYGTVQVKITVAGGKITNDGFVQLTAYDGRSQEINSQAAPILLQETLTAQSAQIDTVSGASYTSDGYVQSLQSALDKAGIR